MEAGAFVHIALYGDLARVFLDDAVGDGESSPVPLLWAVARRTLGGKEGIVDAKHVLR